MITVDSRRKKPATLAARHPGALILDVTSRGPEPWVRFSPFYPHGGIPVPLMQDRLAQSVEGIWQGLKVFEQEGVDAAKLDNTTMKSLKRGMSARRGSVRGHRAGLLGTTLLSYADARRQIYLPAYRWVLENRLSAELARLSAETRPIVLLDYELNCDIDDLRRPLSHAGLIACYLAGNWPA
ncbi:MAG: hypothetical protein ACI8RZ_002386 [Myxococcota bacterium]|jgi:hypothetical protein